MHLQPGKVYPISLYHDGNHTWRVVHSSEEYSSMRLKGWMDKPTPGVTYVVHTSVPPLDPEFEVPGPMEQPGQCPNCAAMSETFETAWAKLNQEHRLLQARFNALEAAAIGPQVSSVAQGADSAAGTAPEAAVAHTPIPEAYRPAPGSDGVVAGSPIVPPLKAKPRKE